MNKLIIAFILISSSLLGQKNHGGLVISKTTIDFGEVENWVSGVDSIEVTNITAETIYLLKLKHPRGFEVSFPHLGLKSGETGFIKIIYNPKKAGKFNQTLKLFHSASKKQFSIKFKGNILSIDPYSDLACPSFAKPNFNRFLFDLEIEVLDSLTKEPINQAFLEIYKHEKFVQLRTDKTGKIIRKSNVGLYEIYFEKEGYNNKFVSHYFNPRSRKITVLLPRSKNPRIFKPVEIDDRSIVFRQSIKDTLTLRKTEQVIKQKEIEIDKGEFSLDDFKKNNLVFLIDVSSSMRGKDRLDLLKVSLIELVKLLRPEDEITLITYSDEAKVLLTNIKGDNKKQLIKTINSLKALGSTQGGKAIKKAYHIAELNFIQGGNNQILLATDGGFNALGKSEKSLNRFVKKKTKKSINFSVLAFGKNKYGKEFMRDLSSNGKGNYLYIENLEQAKVELKETIKYQSEKP